MSSTSLFLAPAEISLAPDRDAVERVLKSLDIIAGPLGGHGFLAGDGFSRHIIYAGCSPYLVLDPPEDGSLQFCHVVIHGPFELPRLITGPNTVKPRCPACRARFQNWRDSLDSWRLEGSAARCDQCGETFTPCLLDWRQHAICGRLLIELRNVFPGEASPSDRLLHLLEQVSKASWCYAWAGYLLD